MTPSAAYILISPCRNEERFVARSIDSVLKQSRLPAKWIIVDDGSTDETPHILAEYAKEVDFLEIATKSDRGYRHVGGGVIEAFNFGLRRVAGLQYDFLCKLDLDLILPPRYFEQLIEMMLRNPRLGTCSGKPYYRTATGKDVLEPCGNENSIGASKFYRRECFEEIGGFEPRLMWDGIDCHKCRMRGWFAMCSDDSDLLFEHLRPMGSSHRSILHGRMRYGEGQYSMGTGPAYLLASAFYRVGSRPWLFGSLATLWGYASAAMRRIPRYQDKEFVQFLHRFQWQSLVRGKSKVVREIDKSTEEIWRRHHLPHGLSGLVTHDVERIWTQDHANESMSGPRRTTVELSTHGGNTAQGLHK